VKRRKKLVVVGGGGGVATTWEYSNDSFLKFCFLYIKKITFFYF
jgi:hypothetical protein